MKRGEGTEMNWEIGIDKYTLLCVKPIASGKLLHNKESSAGALWWPTAVGWEWRWEGGPRRRG